MPPIINVGHAQDLHLVGQQVHASGGCSATAPTGWEQWKVGRSISDTVARLYVVANLQY